MKIDFFFLNVLINKKIVLPITFSRKAGLYNYEYMYSVYICYIKIFKFLYFKIIYNSIDDLKYKIWKYFCNIYASESLK